MMQGKIALEEHFFLPSYGAYGADSSALDGATKAHDYDPGYFADVQKRLGEATLRLDAVDREHIALDVKFDRAIAARPFAALRSMFVTETNADAAQVAWRAPRGKAYEAAPIMSFGRADALELWAGRRLPSRHNTSAPDMILRSFMGGD